MKIDPCHRAKSQGEVIASTALLKYVEIGVLFSGELQSYPLRHILLLS